MDQSLDDLSKEVCEFIAHPEPDRFERLALGVFAFQFSRNPRYHNYCLRKGKTPDTVAHWEEIPEVPTTAFKEMDLTCLPDDQTPEAVFLTSGTTLGRQKQGKHVVPRISVVEAAIIPNFKVHLLPDSERMRMMILTGSPSEWPHSSLSYMMEVVRKTYGTPQSCYYINEEGLDFTSLIHDLKTVEKTGEPVFLMGITSAFYRLLEQNQDLGMTFTLPAGSRMMDTGGFKGQQVPLTQEDLYHRYEQSFGVPRNFIVNEYGMTEMGSQFYDNTLANYLSRRHGPRFKTIPPWVRTRIVDPDTLEGVPPGSTGMLKHLDLANCGSVMALLTEDLGRTLDHGFEIVGRIGGAESRGCSLMIEELRGK